MSQLLIIGGGITGLAAAWEAVQFPRVEVTLIDAQPATSFASSLP